MDKNIENRNERRKIDYFVHESSYIDENVMIGEGTKIWHFCHVQSGARIGKYCRLGQNVNIANNVVIVDQDHDYRAASSASPCFRLLSP